jgi:hypothetical protein
MYNKVADSSYVAIQKQRFSIVDTRVPAFAMHLLLFLSDSQMETQTDLDANRNRIWLVRRRRGACQLVSTGLHRIESVSTAVVRRRLLNILCLVCVQRFEPSG